MSRTAIKVTALVIMFIHITRMDTIAQSGNVGINTLIPTAPLHVVLDAPNSGPKLNHVMAIFEGNDESFIQLSNPENASTGILSGDRWTPLRSALIFGGDSSITFKSGGDFPRMFISKTGRIGMNTLAPQALLHVQDSSVLFAAPDPLPPYNGNPPAMGAGTRMMWYPGRAAFRAGTVIGAQWNKENTGVYSFAGGFNTMAKGNYSLALGAQTKANGLVSSAFGGFSRADGDYSTSFGYSIAKAYACVTIGGYNDTSAASSVDWINTDPIFLIGNGTSVNRNNAFTVLKNGRIGINTAHPGSIFHVVKGGLSGGPYSQTAMATFESNIQAYIHLSQPNSVQSGLLSGNELTTIRSGLIFGADSSMIFRTGGNTTRMFLDKTGKLGISTSSPKSLLHIRMAGASGGPFHPLSHTILESNVSSYIQFSHKNNTETGLLSGNESTEIRSAIVFKPDSSMILRTGGNVDRINITNDGMIGINVPYPYSQLHVRKGSTYPGLIHGDAIATFQSASPAFIHFAVPSGINAGILASNNVSAVRSGIIFNGDNSLELRAGGDNRRLKIAADGKIGIKTDSPVADLDVNGTFRLGDDGSALTDIIQQTFSKNLPSIPAYGSIVESFTNSTFNNGGTAFVSLGHHLPDGIVIAYTTTSLGIVEIKFTNITSAAIDPGTNAFHITVIQ